MWIKASGPLTENVTLVTTPVSSHLVILGEMTALVDSGIYSFAPRLIEELQGALQGQDLNYILLTHTHFDHLGGIPALRKAAPGVKLVASPLASEILADKKNLAALYEKNKACAEALGMEFDITLKKWSAAFEVDRVVGDGDSLELGAGSGAAVDVKIIAVPGHSADSVAYYVRPDGALAGSESLGSWGGRDKFAPAFNASFSQYLIGLEKLAGLEVRTIGFPHTGALSGDLAGKYLVQARVEAERFAEQIRDRLAHGELLEEVYSAILLEWIEQNICPEGPFADEQGATLMEMIKAVAQNS